MPPIPVFPWNDARSMPPGELQIVGMRIGQILLLNNSVGRRSTERTGSDLVIIFHLPICLEFLVDYFTSFV
jgi:hypothetical protein